MLESLMTTSDSIKGKVRRLCGLFESAKSPPWGADEAQTIVVAHAPSKRTRGRTHIRLRTELDGRSCRITTCAGAAKFGDDPTSEFDLHKPDDPAPPPSGWIWPRNPQMMAKRTRMRLIVSQLFLTAGPEDLGSKAKEDEEPRE
ncbi:hypothetical protein NL676_011885 [Syzygium grande]|nr:hypothetical protein NL676_011885 [Syzygium grande]